MSTPATLKIAEWRTNPRLFCRDCFGVELDDWQDETMGHLGQPGRKRVALKACAGPGKTAVLAMAGWHRLACFAEKGEHPKGAAISITWENLTSNLWPEMAKWQARSQILTEGFTWTKERIFCKSHPETWFLAAKSFPKTADQEAMGRTLSGLHSRFPFYLIDESGDMSTQILKAAEQGLSTCADGLILTAGNPTSREGLLYHASSAARDQWSIVTISGDPDNPRRSKRIDLAWAKDQIERYGRDNPWVMAYVLGEFPPGSINALLGVDEVERAYGKFLRREDYEWAQKRLGVDVARFGDDRSVIFPRQGLVAFNPVVMRHQRTTDIAARVAAGRARWRPERIFVDDTGHWGHGVIDNLLAGGIDAVGIQFHGKAIHQQYANRRAEMWISMAEWIKRGGSIPKIPELISELTAPTYTLVNGKFLLEDKDQIKKRLGKSPDLADALALTFAEADQPAAVPVAHPTFGDQEVVADYDPFDWKGDR